MKVTRKNKFWVGLFMASGITVGMLILFWLGVTTFLEEGKRYSTYFDQSVQGLVVDSPVKFRGVAIGRVLSIKVAPDARHVEVILLIEKDLKITDEMFAKLSLVGITGIMFVEIDVLPRQERPPIPGLAFEPAYPVIPSRPSEINRILGDIERVLAKLTEIDLEALSDQALATMNSFNQTATVVREAVDHLEVEKISTSFQSIAEQMSKEIEQVGQVMERAGRLLEQNEPELHQALANFQKAMATLDEFAEQASKVAGDSDEYLSGIYQQLMVLGHGLEQTIRRFDEALEEFIDAPGQMFFREPPPPRQLP